MRLIDADVIDKMYVPIAPVIEGDAVHYEWVAFVEDINKLPTIDAQTKEGQWVKADRQQYFRKHYPASQCSICGWRKNYSGKYNYCPNCGAKME